MQQEDKTTEISDVKTGLELSDAEYAAHPAITGGAGDENNGPGRADILRIAAAFSSGVLACLIVLALLTYVFDIFRLVPGSQYSYYAKLDDACGKYYEILELIGDDPIAKVRPQDINDDMLKELVRSSGDPYAEYFTKEEYEEFRKSYIDGYVGIGVGVVQKDEGIVIRSVFRDGPADAAGVEVGDIITEVDGKKPADIDEAIDMIGGNAGTGIKLTVSRDGESIDFDITREMIDEDSVLYTGYEKDPSIGVIRITAFKKGTADEFRIAVKELRNSGCESYVIDLRSNGGGLTDECVEIADYLLPECRIMTEVKKDKSEEIFNSKAGSAEIDYVVLTDGGTASASEILAGAIQDNGGGIIIGEKTYGKGVTQLTRRFKDGSAVKMTECEYLRPDGGRVDGIGITPDIETDAEDAFDTAIGELKK